MRKVIVSGATSMIGISLVETLLKDENIEVIYAVVRPDTKKWYRMPSDSRIKRVDCELLDYSTLPQKINEECDIFYHLAWVRTATYEEDSKDMVEKCHGIQGVIYAVDAANLLGCKTFVWAGSQSEYGLIDGVITPDSQCNPVRVDGIAHYAAGRIGKILAQKYKISFIWMRVFSVYGKYDRENSLISSTIKKLQLNQRCSFSPLEQIWDYINVKDVSQAFYLVGKMINESKTYCIGSGDERPLREYVEIIKEIVSPGSELGIGDLKYPENAVMNLRVDNTALSEDTGWFPKISFYDGIIELVKLGENAR